MSHTRIDPRAAPESGRLVLRAGIAVTYSTQTAEGAEVFGQDRRDIVM
jgi:hypothetical protein